MKNFKFEVEEIINQRRKTSNEPNQQKSRSKKTSSELRSHWNSKKRQRTVSLSDDGWEVLSDLSTNLSDKGQWNRSETIEIMARYFHRNNIDLIKARQEELS